MLKYDAVSFSYPAGDNYEIQNRSFKELMPKKNCSTTAQTFDLALAVRFRFCINGQTFQLTATDLRKVNLYFE